MKLTKLTTALAMTTVMVATQAGVVRADSATTTPTPTPVVETRTECTTGAYGQQTCKTVEVKKVVATTPEKAVVKEAGVEDMIPFAVLGLMAVSAYGLSYAKRQ